jgi:hypothetical protein
VVYLRLFLGVILLIILLLPQAVGVDISAEEEEELERYKRE